MKVWKLITHSGCDSCVECSLPLCFFSARSKGGIGKRRQLAVAEESKKAATAAKEDQAAAKKTAPTVAATKKAAPVPAGERVSFSEFVKTFSDNYQKPVTETVLINAFNVFDPSHSGKLTLTQLHDILTKRGEPLPKTEVDELMLIAALGSAKQADYALLAKRLLKGPAGIAKINAS
ncbi:myosin regulatory light chain [Cyclospora cayetanensis]|uniref:Myosin regulatory light chain n=1 Tax=Cyclospora cayetanensis TaxID=88456 RepID=A0A1D3CUT5_9EIME|nr:myosin regulatory light chain [Cyclospora cayetanensis]